MTVFIVQRIEQLFSAIITFSSHTVEAKTLSELLENVHKPIK